MEKKERRAKKAYLNQDDIVQAFLYQETGFLTEGDVEAVDTLKRIKLVGIPEGCKVAYGWYDAARAAFAIVIEHPSFEIVPTGEIPPTISVEFLHIYVDSQGREKRGLSWRDKPRLA